MTIFSTIDAADIKVGMTIIDNDGKTIKVAKVSVRPFGMPPFVKVTDDKTNMVHLYGLGTKVNVRIIPSIREAAIAAFMERYGFDGVSVQKNGNIYGKNDGLPALYVGSLDNCRTVDAPNGVRFYNGHTLVAVLK